MVLQLQDLTSLAGRRRRLELLAELGVAIQREWTEAAISQRVRLGLAAVDLSPVLMRPTGDGVELVWARFPAAFDAAVQAAAGRPLDGMVGRWTDQSRAVWSTGSAYSDDWITHGARFPGVVAADQLGAAAAALGLVRALAVRLDERRGSTGILVAIGDWIRHDDLPAFRLFGAQVATETLRTGLPTWTENTQLDPRSAMFGRTDVPALAMLAVPLAARASRRGVMLVAADAGHRFTAAERTLGSALGAELALALENAELYDQVLATNADLGREQEKNIRKSRLEALGELSAIIAHEVRNPLGVIFNSLGSLRRLVGPTGDARMLLDIVGEEADRLNRIVGDLLDFARHSPPVLVPDRLE